MMYKLAAAAGLLLASASAQATVTNSFAQGTFGFQAGDTQIADFDTSFGGAVLTGAGTDYYTGDHPGIAAPPGQTDTTQYLAVLSGGSATFAFNSAAGISFDVGSVDDFNKVTVTLTGAGGTAVLNGSDINNNAANGNQTSNLTNGRVTIFGTAGEMFTGVVFSSSGNSFEIDNLATTGAVPEASTWAMFLMGFGALGAATRRRQRSALSFG